MQYMRVRRQPEPACVADGSRESMPAAALCEPAATCFKSKLKTDLSEYIEYRDNNASKIHVIINLSNDVSIFAIKPIY